MTERRIDHEARLTMLEERHGDMIEMVRDLSRDVRRVIALTSDFVPRDEIDERFEAMASAAAKQVKGLLRALLAAAAVLLGVPSGIASGIQVYHLVHPATVHTVPGPKTTTTETVPKQ